MSVVIQWIKDYWFFLVFSRQHLGGYTRKTFFEALRKGITHANFMYKFNKLSYKTQVAMYDRLKREEKRNDG